MCSPEELPQVLSEVVTGLKDVFGAKLEDVILYGSCARGEADEESDIDIMALISGVSREELWRYDTAVSRQLSRIEREWDYDVLLCVILEDVSTFEKYADYTPFFKNVMLEGISLVRAAVH